MKASMILFLPPAVAVLSGCDVFGTSAHLLPGDGASDDGTGGDADDDAAPDAGDAGDPGQDGHDAGFDGGHDAGMDGDCGVSPSGFTTISFGFSDDRPIALGAGNLGKGNALDLVVAGEETKSLYFYFDISFSDSLDFSGISTAGTIGSLQAMTIINPDGQFLDDIAVLTISGGTPPFSLVLRAFKNPGSDSFGITGTPRSLSENLTAPLTGEVSLGAGRFSGDEFVDLVAACPYMCGQSGAFFWDDPAYGFSEKTSIASPGALIDALAVADLNGDGFDDLVAGISMMSENHAITWGLSNQQGDFDWATQSSRISLEDNEWVRDLALADFNRDGILDLAALIHEGSQAASVRIYSGIKNPNFSGFSQRTEATIGSTGAIHPRLAAADLDRDGDFDLVALSRDSDKDALFLFENTNPDAFAFSTVPLSYPCGVGPALDLLVADLDGNSSPDIAVACAGTTGQIVFLLNRCP